MKTSTDERSKCERSEDCPTDKFYVFENFPTDQRSLGGEELRPAVSFRPTTVRQSTVDSQQSTGNERYTVKIRTR